MHRPAGRRIAALVAAGSLVLVLASPALATIEPPCSGTGTATSSGTIDLTTATEWHMLSTDIAGGQGQSTVEMKAGSVAAYGLGIAIPIAGGSGDGDTAGSVDGVSVETYAILGQRFLVAGSASGDDGSCSGSITIILDDVNPLFTAFGGGGLLLGIIGLVLVLLGARSGGGCLMRVLGGLFGFVSGAGFGLAGEQFGILDPSVPIGLGLAIVLAILGFAIAGRMGNAAAPPPA